MKRLLLVRHAPTAETGPKLTGRKPGVSLSPEGVKMAEEVGLRLAAAPLKRIYVSPMERTRETAAAIAKHHRLTPIVRDGLNEVDYGAWQGKSFKVLYKTPIWPQLFSAPSRVRFPGGESLADAQARALAACEAILAETREGMVAAVTHADVIRLVLAHYLGIHLDLYQRLHIAPASISVVDVGDRGVPSVLAVNVTAGDPPWLQMPQKPAKAKDGGASTEKPPSPPVVPAAGRR
jgi:probable phosphomutase (TIGR03848 family)